ncbi:MAG: hypothetical protein HC779_04845 [Phyllobacteriaceae bacterium]|nr:hypothetical protein [Phyllobacteriaceae bacterium]
MNLIASTPMFKLLGLVSPLRTKWMMLDVLSFFALVITIYWAIRHHAVRIDKRLGIAALLCFAFFLILPKQVFGSMAADMRLMPYALLAGLLAIPAKGLSRKTLHVLTVAALLFLPGAPWQPPLPYAEDERSRGRPVLPTLDSMPAGRGSPFSRQRAARRHGRCRCSIMWPVLPMRGAACL